MRLNIKVVRNDIGKKPLFRPNVYERVLFQVQAKYMLMQRSRVRRGIDVLGAPFEPYSDEYRKLKTNAGRMTMGNKKAQGFWLRLTGQMFRSQKSTIAKYSRGARLLVAFEGMHGPTYISGGTVRQGSGRQVSNAFIAASNDRRRMFIGINDQELKTMAGLVKRALKRELTSG